MAAPNSNYTDLITTTLEYRQPEIVDNVTTNNAVTAWLKANGGYKVIEGGQKIVEPLAWQSNTNGGWYQGWDQLPVGPQEEFTGAEFPWKQLAVPVIASGLETEVQNVGQAAVFDLFEERIKNAERTAGNIMAVGSFSDGTGAGGKQMTGVYAMCPTTPNTGVYGGINRATAANAFWRPKYTGTGHAPAAATIQADFNTFWYPLVRGTDKPKLIACDSAVMGAYEASLQLNQRFTDPKSAQLGFIALKYKTADVVYDANCLANTAFFLNTDYMRIRVAKRRNFKALPARNAFNQDGQVVMLAAALNMTCSASFLQGRVFFG